MTSSVCMVLLFIAPFLVWYWTMHKADKRAVARFVARERIPFDQWYDTYYPNGEVSEAAAGEVSRLVAEAIGVHQTQILPTDRIAVEFDCSDGPWCIVDHRLDVFECVFEELSYNHNIPMDRFWNTCNTVDDIIKLIDKEVY